MREKGMGRRRYRIYWVWFKQSTIYLRAAADLREATRPGRWAVTGARRAQVGSDLGPSRLFPAPALTLSPPAEELTSLGCCGSGGGEEAVHDEDGRRRVREEASDLGKEGRSRVRKWCNGGRRRWRKADAAAAPGTAAALSASRERGSVEESD